MNGKLRSLCLIIAGVIHLIPVSGVLGAQKLSSLYGLAIDDPSLAILLQHRAVLFGILGVVLVLAAFQPRLQFWAIVTGLVSAVSFIVIAVFVGDYNDAVSRIIVGDIVASVSLLVAALLVYSDRQQSITSTGKYN